MDIKDRETPASAGLSWRNKSRRTYTPAQRLAMVRECEAPGVSVAEIAQRHRVNANLLFKWRRMHLRGLLPLPETSTALVPVTVLKGKNRASRGSRGAPPGAAPSAGAIEIEVAGARIFLYGSVCEANLAIVLRLVARR